MCTSYEEVYANILPKFEDFDLPKLDLDDVESMFYSYLNTAITKFHLCKQNLNDRNEEEKKFNIKLTQDEINILSNYILLEYLDSTYIRTPTLLKATLSSADFNAFSNANLLGKLIDMHKTFLSENETLLSRYSWMDDKVKNNNLIELVKRR